MIFIVYNPKYVNPEHVKYLDEMLHKTAVDHVTIHHSKENCLPLYITDGRVIGADNERVKS